MFAFGVRYCRRKAQYLRASYTSSLSASDTTRTPNEGEREGVDFHFVSVSEFESMVETSRFIEYGSYQKTLYGTAVDSVNKIVDSGKICVLNLHAQVRRKGAAFLPRAAVY